MAPPEPPACPYCRRPLQYVADQWFGQSVFECEQCGDFPDFGSSLASAPPAAGADPEPVPPRNAGRPRVLLVVEGDEQRNLYAEMLKPGAAVSTAARGDHALSLASADPPEVIILDVMMAGMDSWETCERLKADPATKHIPIIMLTSLDAVDVPARAREAGVVAVLMKPCPAERLVLAIAAARQPVGDRGRESA